MKKNSSIYYEIKTQLKVKMFHKCLYVNSYTIVLQ